MEWIEIEYNCVSVWLWIYLFFRQIDRFDGTCDICIYNLVPDPIWTVVTRVVVELVTRVIVDIVDVCSNVVRMGGRSFV